MERSRKPRNPLPTIRADFWNNQAIDLAQSANTSGGLFDMHASSFSLKKGSYHVSDKSSYGFQNARGRRTDGDRTAFAVAARGGPTGSVCCVRVPEHQARHDQQHEPGVA